MTTTRQDVPEDVEVVVIGGGQAGLSAARFLAARSPTVSFVVLDANDGPGGAWRHRWPSLRMGEVHGLHPLPDGPEITGDEDAPARDVVAASFADYERDHDLPVRRPVEVESVHEAGDGRLLVATDAGTWRTRGLLNATGTWTRPFWPVYPGAASFRGRQLHSADYEGPDGFAGDHVVVVGGGHSAIAHLADLAGVATTTWVTRRPPRWRTTEFDADAGRDAVARVADAVAAGRRPDSVVSVTGLPETPALVRARDAGVLDRLPMFDRITPSGVAWDDGRTLDADVLLWATGFRHALGHLAPLGLRDPKGGIRMAGTQVADDPRLHLLGYGPSASTIGANRAARTAVRDLRRTLDLAA